MAQKKKNKQKRKKIKWTIFFLFVSHLPRFYCKLNPTFLHSCLQILLHDRAHAVEVFFKLTMNDFLPILLKKIIYLKKINNNNNNSLTPTHIGITAGVPYQKERTFFFLWCRLSFFFFLPLPICCCSQELLDRLRWSPWAYSSSPPTEEDQIDPVLSCREKLCIPPVFHHVPLQRIYIYMGTNNKNVYTQHVPQNIENQF